MQFCTDQLTGQTLNKPILIVPTANLLLATNQMIYAGLPITLTPVAGCAITNLMPGGYDCTIQGVSRTFTILVPETNGLIQAADWMVAPTNAAWPGAATAWSISASEARFLHPTNPPGTAGQVVTSDGTNAYFATPSGSANGGGVAVGDTTLTAVTNLANTLVTLTIPPGQFDPFGSAIAVSNGVVGFALSIGSAATIHADSAVANSTNTAPFIWAQFPLPRFRSKSAAAIFGLTNLDILLVGDSTTFGYGAGYAGETNCMQSNVTAQAVSLIPSARLGWIGSHTFNSHTNYMVIGSFDSSLSIPTNWSVLNFTSFAGQLLYATANTTNAIVYSPTRHISGIKIYSYGVSGGGTCDLNVILDGSQTIATIHTGSIAASGLILTNCVFASGLHSIALQPTNSSTVGCYALGMVPFTTNSLNVINAGWESSTTGNWLSSGTPYAPLVLATNINPDLVLLNLGINDYRLGLMNSFSNNLFQIVTNFQGTTKSDVVLVVPSEGFGMDFSSLSEAIYGVANQLGCPVLDFRRQLGSHWSVANALGEMFDGLHPNAIGYADEARLLVSLFAPWFSGSDYYGRFIGAGSGLTNIPVSAITGGIVTNGQAGISLAPVNGPSMYTYANTLNISGGTSGVQFNNQNNTAALVNISETVGMTIWGIQIGGTSITAPDIFTNAGQFGFSGGQNGFVWNNSANTLNLLSLGNGGTLTLNNGSFVGNGAGVTNLPFVALTNAANSYSAAQIITNNSSIISANKMTNSSLSPSAVVETDGNRGFTSLAFDGNTTHFLNGNGAWSAPGAGGTVPSFGPQFGVGNGSNGTNIVVGVQLTNLNVFQGFNLTNPVTGNWLNSTNDSTIWSNALTGLSASLTNGSLNLGGSLVLGSAVPGISGDGSGLTGLKANNLASGLVATARLGGGTASSSTYLRGDQTYATPVRSASLGGTGGSSSTPASSTTYYFGYYTGNNWTTFATEGKFDLALPETGTIIAYAVHLNGTGGDATTCTFSLDYNLGTTFGSSSQTLTGFPKTFVVGGLSQSVTAGNTLGLKLTTGSFGTAPTSCTLCWEVVYTVP